MERPSMVTDLSIGRNFRGNLINDPLVVKEYVERWEGILETQGTRFMDSLYRGLHSLFMPCIQPFERPRHLFDLVALGFYCEYFGASFAEQFLSVVAGEDDLEEDEDEEETVKPKKNRPKKLSPAYAFAKYFNLKTEIQRVQYLIMFAGIDLYLIQHGDFTALDGNFVCRTLDKSNIIPAMTVFKACEPLWKRVFGSKWGNSSLFKTELQILCRAKFYRASERILDNELELEQIVAKDHRYPLPFVTKLPNGRIYMEPEWATDELIELDERKMACLAAAVPILTFLSIYLAEDLSLYLYTMKQKFLNPYEPAPCALLFAGPGGTGKSTLAHLNSSYFPGYTVTEEGGSAFGAFNSVRKDKLVFTLEELAPKHVRENHGCINEMVTGATFTSHAKYAEKEASVRNRLLVHVTTNYPQLATTVGNRRFGVFWMHRGAALDGKRNSTRNNRELMKIWSWDKVSPPDTWAKEVNRLWSKWLFRDFDTHELTETHKDENCDYTHWDGIWNDALEVFTNATKRPRRLVNGQPDPVQSCQEQMRVEDSLYAFRQLLVTGKLDSLINVDLTRNLADQTVYGTRRRMYDELNIVGRAYLSIACNMLNITLNDFFSGNVTFWEAVEREADEVTREDDVSKLPLLGCLFPRVLIDTGFDREECNYSKETLDAHIQNAYASYVQHNYASGVWISNQDPLTYAPTTVFLNQAKAVLTSAESAFLYAHRTRWFNYIKTESRRYKQMQIPDPQCMLSGPRFVKEKQIIYGHTNCPGFRTMLTYESFQDICQEVETTDSGTVYGPNKRTNKRAKYYVPWKECKLGTSKALEPKVRQQFFNWYDVHVKSTDGQQFTTAGNETNTKCDLQFVIIPPALFILDQFNFLEVKHFNPRWYDKSSDSPFSLFFLRARYLLHRRRDE